MSLGLRRTALQEKQDRQLLSVCTNVAALSLAVVMAGSGDLDTLRILRRLHRRIAPEVIVIMRLLRRVRLRDWRGFVAHGRSLHTDHLW